MHLQNQFKGLNLDQGSFKVLELNSNHNQDLQPQSQTPSITQNPKSGLKGHGGSLHIQNKDREPKFGTLVYQRPVTISKSRSRCKPQSGTSSVLQSPKAAPKGHGYSLHLQNQDREQKFGNGVYQRPVTTSK